MKKIVLSTLLVGLLATSASFAADQKTPAKTTAAPAATAPAVNLNSDAAKLGYVMGLNMGTNFRTYQISVDQNAFLAGLNAGLQNTPPQLTPAQIQEILGKFQKEVMAKQQALFKAQAEKNLKAGQAFLAANKKQAGVEVTKDGLQYKVIKKGTGPVPTKADTVEITYEGKLVDGRVFDSTTISNKGKPASLPVGQVIPGMQEALSMMPVGSTWEVVIPSQLAYGDHGLPGGLIGPNETLVFNITLVGIDKKAK